jgi:hypothetical protein
MHESSGHAANKHNRGCEDRADNLLAKDYTDYNYEMHRAVGCLIQ